MFESYYYRKKDEKLLDIYTLEDADECQRTNQNDKKRKCIPFKGMFTRTLWHQNVHDLDNPKPKFRKTNPKLVNTHI